MSGNDDDDKVVTFDRTRRRPDAARVREFAETARRLQNERSGAAEVVNRHLQETPRDEWPRLAEEPEMRTSGALEQIAARIRSSCEKGPQEALALTSLATTIAETLAPDSYPPVILAQLRAHAWKDRAHALRYLGRCDEALEAAGIAEKRLEPFASTAHDRAVVALVKASTLQQMERFDESQELLETCSAVFRDHGDSRLFLYCGLMEGNLRYRRQQYVEARDVWRPLLEVALKAGDFESAARIHNNLGCVDVQLGQFADAQVHLSEAKAIFVDLGKPVEAVRTDHGYGLLLIAKGKTDAGVAILRKTRAAFLHHELVQDAGLCGLAIAEALVASDRAVASDLVAEILDDFTTAHLNPGAIEAVAYLQRAIIERSASTEVFRHVGSYIESLRKDPTIAFALPA